MNALCFLKRQCVVELVSTALPITAEALQSSRTQDRAMPRTQALCLYHIHCTECHLARAHYL